MAGVNQNRIGARTILVVDDEFDIREAVRDILEGEGYRVVPASNGREALEALRGAKPGLVLLDLMMPEMNGWQFIEALRSRDEFARLPVVAVSASDNIPRGVNGIIRKPFSLDHLLHAVERHLDHT